METGPGCSEVFQWYFLLKTGDFPGICHLRKFQGGTLPSPHGKTGGLPRISNKNLALKYKRLKMLGPMGPLISCLVGTASWKPQNTTRKRWRKDDFGCCNSVVLR